MRMEKEIIMAIGEAIRRVEEVETYGNRDCIGQIIRLRVSIDIIKPLINILYVMEEDNQAEKILITVQYETLPHFCHYCGCFGHQYRECTAYRNQAEEDFPYGSWVKARTTAEKWKQSRGKGKRNTAPEGSQAQPRNPNSKDLQAQILRKNHI